MIDPSKPIRAVGSKTIYKYIGMDGKYAVVSSGGSYLKLDLNTRRLVGYRDVLENYEEITFYVMLYRHTDGFISYITDRKIPSKEEADRIGTAYSSPDSVFIRSEKVTIAV